jgi:hypothetical protein
MGIIAPRQNWLNRNASAHGSSQQAVFGMFDGDSTPSSRASGLHALGGGRDVNKAGETQTSGLPVTNEPSPKQAPGYRGKGFRPDVSGRHQSPKRASGNCAVRIKWIPRNGWRLTMSGWSVRFPKQARPPPARRETAPFPRLLLPPCMSNDGPVFKIPRVGTGSNLHEIYLFVVKA